MGLQHKDYNPDLAIGGSNDTTIAQTITAASTAAMTVGANGATNPVFNVNTNTASVATGIDITGAAEGAGVQVTALSSGTNEALTISSKGTGALTLNATGTGSIVLGEAVTASSTLTVTGAVTHTSTTLCSDSVTIASGKSIIGAGTGANGITLKNLKNSAATALSGTQLDITIDIGGTPYYFTVYPTKA